MTQEILPKKKPLENFFGLPASDEEKKKKEELQNIVIAPIYDEKDKELEDLYAEIQERAVTAHEKILDEIEDSDSRGTAHLYEVSNGFLNTALAALEKRSKLKEHKDKLHTKTQKDLGSTKITNQSITINTTDLIQKIVSGNVIEGEVISDSKPQDKKDE